MSPANVVAIEKPLEHRESGSPSLEDILNSTWEELARGATRRAHAYHLGVFATSGCAGPSLRTVVLRDVSPEQRVLISHTDTRSEKLTDIRQESRVAWLFYDAATKIQLRLSGTAAVHIQDEVARLRWERTNASARRCYLTTHAPGESLAGPGVQMAAYLDRRAPSAAESEGGFPHFAVISCQVSRIDWLRLNARGHERALFSWVGTDWRATWAAP